MTTPSSIPDVQGSPDTRQIAINKVGIKDIRHPVGVRGRDGQVQRTVADIDMYVALPEHLKGTHMSRFVEILNAHENALSMDEFGAMLREVSQRLQAEVAHVDMRFPYFVTKRAPVSGVQSVMDYGVTLSGEAGRGGSRQTLKVLVPVTSLCPCSKKISEYGAHNQRAHVTVSAECKDGVWIEDLIDVVEREASSELYGVLKRVDEKHVTERAYENPKFVEDMVRDVARELNRDARIVAYQVEVENFESIHNHSAYAMIALDKRNM